MKWILVILLMIQTILPVHAEGGSFSAVFSDPGKLEQASESYAYQDLDHAVIDVWRDDLSSAKIAVTAEAGMTISASVSAFSRKNGEVLSADSVSIGWLADTEASLGTREGSPSILVPDRITAETEKIFSAGETGYLWITVRTDCNTAAGTYDGTIVLRNGTSEETCRLRIRVSSLVNEENFSLDLWQYPYASLRYYQILNHEEAFSAAHQNVLRQTLRAYYDAGGRTITASILDEPWSHQTYDDYPGMVRWSRNAENQIVYDYSAFDAWVSLCMEEGIDERIECFTILPWNNKITVHHEDGTAEGITAIPKTDEYTWIWSAFLRDFIAHLEEKGWKDKTVIAMDERNPAMVQAAIQVILSVTGSDGKPLGISDSINSLMEDISFYDDIDILSVSLGCFSDSALISELISHRKAFGKETILYNCSGNYPNAFAFSEPEESLWVMYYAAALGFDGYMRWALDAWNEDPLSSADYMPLESGDTFLLYPGEKDGDGMDLSESVRFLMIAQGIRNARKALYLKEHLEEKELFAEGLESIRRAAGSYHAHGAMTAADGSSEIISSEASRMQELIRLGTILMEREAAGSDPGLYVLRLKKIAEQ